MRSIPVNGQIRNFCTRLGLQNIYTSIVITHIIAFLTAMVLKGFSAKMTDIEEISGKHRTTASYFLSKSPWDERPLKEIIKSQSFAHVSQLAKQTGAPIFVSIDDTVNPKRKPSSRALRPMGGATHHHSHLLGKRVWGHQVQAMMVSCGKIALNYDLQRYDKAVQTKIQSGQTAIGSLPIPETKAYVLGDSWYSCAKIIDASFSRGYHYIGAMRTNRIIYPQGIRISIDDFAQHIELNDVDLVTVDKKQYYTYRYEGKLNGVDNAVVILSWPKNAFKVPKALRAFISTDTELSTVTILEYYASRWCIETFFSQSKDTLGFGKYQIRSIRGIERLWILMSLCHLMCTVGLSEPMSFGAGLRCLRHDIEADQVAFIYHSALLNVPLEDVIAQCA